jgi:hypothetical protein
MQYFTACVYAAGIRNASDDLNNVTEEEIREVQINGLVNHLLNDHGLCWPEVCWLKENPELQLREPTLIPYSKEEHETFRGMLEQLFSMSQRRAVGTHIRTSANEALNRTKLMWTSKLIDYWKSYATRHALVVLYNNEGILNLLQELRTGSSQLSFTTNDYKNIVKFSQIRQNKRKANQAAIVRRNEIRKEVIQQQQKELRSFDYSEVSNL